eukprot:evm.model.scf_1608.1 EVM.evm.TU.scf_1608.1   scf_1608:17316-27998(-)
MGIGSDILRGIKASGFHQPLPVQQRAIVPLLNGRDMVVQAPPCSGKTTVIAISLSQLVDTTLGEMQALLASPTEELAAKAEMLILETGRFAGVRTHLCVDGADADVQRLQQGGAHIVVGTPARILDLLGRPTLDASHVRTVVLDDVDRMLAMAPRNQVVGVAAAIPDARVVVSSGAAVGTKGMWNRDPAAVVQILTGTGAVLKQEPIINAEPPLDLPPGWLDCPSMGNPLGRFIPAKVPLSGPRYAAIPEDKVFTPETAIQMAAAQQRKVGLVVDLTNSTKYYGPDEFEAWGVEYVKIRCKGRGETPPPRAMNEFMWVVNRYIYSGGSPDTFILVHCTHGFNRTGFLIISAMMRLDCSQSVEHLLGQFSRRRPPGIYKNEYIDELFRYYHEVRPDSRITPAVPDWKGVADEDEDDGGRQGPPVSALVEENACMTKKQIHHDDIIGEEVDPGEEDELRKIVLQNMFTDAGRNFQRFPGSQPVSLSRRNLRLLKEYRYFVTWKADGTRYLLLIMSFGTYLIDRRFKFRRVQMRFPLPAQQTSNGHVERQEKGVYHGTLLDGEMIVDYEPEEKVYTRRYLVYDLIALNKTPLNSRPFLERHKCIDSVIAPRRQEETEIQHGLVSYKYQYNWEPFRMRKKDFWPLGSAPKVFSMMMKGLTHEADGLILQPAEAPYTVGTCHELLKWKFASVNSVDFRLRITPMGPQLLLFHRGREEVLQGAEVVFTDGRDAHQYDGKIIECSYQNGKWPFLRERVDKSTPNARHVYDSVKQSIDDNISDKEILCHLEGAYSSSEVYAPDRHEAQRQQQQRRR